VPEHPSVVLSTTANLTYSTRRSCPSLRSFVVFRDSVSFSSRGCTLGCSIDFTVQTRSNHQRRPLWSAGERNREVLLARLHFQNKAEMKAIMQSTTFVCCFSPFVRLLVLTYVPLTRDACRGGTRLRCYKYDYELHIPQAYSISCPA